MTNTHISLTTDGETVEIFGNRYRLTITPDMDLDINDFDCYGQYGWSEYDRETGQEMPPRHFTAPEMLTILNDVVWWDPPEGFTDMTFREQQQLRHYVSELISFGFKVVTVERLDGTDFYDRPIVVDAASVGGVDSTEPDVISDCVNDLIQEMLNRS